MTLEAPFDRADVDGTNVRLEGEGSWSTLITEQGGSAGLEIRFLYHKLQRLETAHIEEVLLTILGVGGNRIGMINVM